MTPKTTTLTLPTSSSLVLIKGKKYLDVTNKNLYNVKAVEIIDTSKSDTFFEHVVSKHWTPQHKDVTKDKIDFARPLDKIPSWLDRIHYEKLSYDKGSYSRMIRRTQNNHSMIELYDEMYIPATNLLKTRTFNQIIRLKMNAILGFSLIQWIIEKWEAHKIWQERKASMDRNGW